MDLKSETRQFGGVDITVTEVDAWRGFQMLPRLGSVLGELAPGADGGIDMRKALPGLCSAVASDQALLLDLLAGTTAVVGERVVEIKDKASLNLVFSGKLWAIAETLGLVLEVSFNDFLSQALNAIESLGAAPEAKTAPAE